MTQRVAGWALVVLAILAALMVGRMQGADLAQTDARVARADSIAFTLATAYREQRGKTDRAERRTDALRSRWVDRTNGVTRELTATADELDSARAALADSNVSRDALQSRLAALVMRTDALGLAVIDAQAVTDSLVSAYNTERLNHLAERRVADATLAAKDSVIAALRGKAECRIIGKVPCPKRSTVAGLALVAGLWLGTR